MKHQTCLVTLHKSDFSSLAFFYNSLSLVVITMPRGEELFSGFALLPRLFFCREEEEMLGIYCVCFYRKDRTIIFCLLASGSKSFGFDCICRAVVREFFSRLKSIVASSASWRCCLRVAAKKKFCCHSCALAIFRAKRPLRNVFWVKVLRSTNATQPVYILSRLGITRRSTRAIVSGTIFFSGNKM